MNQSIINIVDLPDEILLYILKKLNNFDVLYSLVGVNEKLDRVVCDVSFTRLVDLITIESNQVTDSRNHAILDRFCMEILPRIHDKVESLTLQACFLPCVLRATNYLQLRKLVIINLKFTMALYIFNEKSPFIYVLKQISDLVVTISDEILEKSNMKLLTYIYNRIFGLVTNLKYLDMDSSDTYTSSRSLLTGLPSTTCCSSSIVHLRIKMQNIDDCLYLLDGRLSQLHTLLIILDYIHDPVQISQMPRLHTFHFDIATEYVSINEQQPNPTPDDIRRTFTERGYHVDCYIDYGIYNSGRCHVYSSSFDMERRFPSIRT
ncbi:unnamed protein product [Rotaria sordida]|uniref:F-box domain-containing protein n=2 Tax=Rotaria sordida TaxID=392033 RepID=A0A815E7L2_9BILA|nr:unnamed protein product [Rotaria sordida]CAF1580341.1 unnamed protein product [Rotaria sordida]